MKSLSAIDTNVQQSDMPVEKSYSIQEAAPVLGISVSTLRNWIRETPPRIESYKAGKKLIRIRESEILRITSETSGRESDTAPPAREDIKQAIREVLQEPETIELIRLSIRKKK